MKIITSTEQQASEELVPGQKVRFTSFDEVNFYRSLDETVFIEMKSEEWATIKHPDGPWKNEAGEKCLHVHKSRLNPI